MHVIQHRKDAVYDDKSGVDSDVTFPVNRENIDPVGAGRSLVAV